MLVVLGPILLAGVAACGGSASHPAAGATGSRGPGDAAGFSAAKLRGALLTRVNGVAAAGPASSGEFTSLAAGSPWTGSAGGGTVTPAACAGGALSGFNPTALHGSQAATVTFKVGKDGVSEMLVASPAGGTAGALADKLPAQCASYQVKAGDKTVSYTASAMPYTAKDAAAKGIGQQAEAISVRSSAGASDSIWSLVYRGAGFVGSVSVTGPDASRTAVEELAKQAYAFAAKTLS